MMNYAPKKPYSLPTCLLVLGVGLDAYPDLKESDGYTGPIVEAIVGAVWTVVQDAIEVNA